jgi:hypothetical protein
MARAQTRDLQALLGQRSATAPSRLVSQRVPPGQRNNSTAAMREQLHMAKANSKAIEATVRSIRGASRATKLRTERQEHQRDWRRTHAELQSQRSESERACALWLQSEAEAVAGDSLRQLQQLARDDAAAGVARREWSVEMRSQLQGLRELCAVSAKVEQAVGDTKELEKLRAEQPVAAAQLVAELSRSLTTQATRLQGAADQLERELHAHAATIFATDDAPDADAPDSESGGAFGDGGAGAAGEIEALAGHTVRPAAERSEAEQRLLEALGAGLRAEEESHREELAALRAEFLGVDGGGDDAEEEEDEEEEEEEDEGRAVGAGGGDDDGEGGGERGGAASSSTPPTEHQLVLQAPAGAPVPPSLLVAGDYYVLDAPAGGDGGEQQQQQQQQQPKQQVGDSDRGGGQPAASAAQASSWGRVAQARLAKLEREFRGRSRAALLTRLRLELPGYSIDRIEAKLSLLGKRRAHASRRRAMVAQWEARKKALALSARQLLHELADREGRLQLKREERALLAARRKELRQTLAVLEQVKATREAEERAAAEEAAAAAASLAEAQRAKAEAERAHKKALIATYQEEKQEEARHAAQAKLEEEAAARAEQLARAVYNLKRVQYRVDLEEKRQVARAEAAEHERLLAEEQVLRLQRVRELAMAQLNVQSDPKRAVGPTMASKAPRQPEEELFAVHGYADETLMKDMRFKLGHALRNAGLNGTDYAREILTSKKWGGPTRPDAVITNFSLGAD